MTTNATTVLYRPVGQAELDLIRDSRWKRFPPRLEFQPIFYPVLTEDYAVRIARDWNTKDPNSGFVGYVLRFNVRKATSIDTCLMKLVAVSSSSTGFPQRNWRSSTTTLSGRSTCCTSFVRETNERAGYERSTFAETG